MTARPEPYFRDFWCSAEFATLSWQQANWLSGDTNVSLSLFQGLTVLGANDATAPLASVLGFEPRFQRLVYTLQRKLPRSRPTRSVRWVLVCGW
jgi:hypothetical protein